MDKSIAYRKHTHTEDKIQNEPSKHTIIIYCIGPNGLKLHMSYAKIRNEDQSSPDELK